MCAIVAQHGNFKALKWMHENGCPWYEETCTEAARGGHLEILRWLIANGCHCHCMRTMEAASGEGHVELLQWVIDNVQYDLMDSPTSGFMEL